MMNKGTIFALLSVAGVGLTGYLSGKAAVKAKDKKPEKPVDYIKTYGPAVVSGVATAALILVGDHVHVSKEAGLAGAAGLYAAKLKGYDKKLDGLLGREKADEVRKEVKTDISNEKAELSTTTPVKSVNKRRPNDILYYEPYTDQYIWSTPERVAWSLLETNKILMKDLRVELNKFITLMGGKATATGDELGWNYDNETQDYAWSYTGGPWLDLTPALTRRGEEDVIVLWFQVDPDTQKPEDMIYSGK